MSLNKVMLIGRLGKDPEIRHTKDGKAIATFSVATSEQWKDKSGEKQEKTEWHNVVIFNENLSKLAEKFLTKGSQVYIEGTLRTRKWEKDGVDRYSTEVILENFNGVMRFLGKPGEGKGEAADEPAPKAKAKPAPKTEAELDDEVPF